MANDCFIKNWTRKNKSWLLFLFWLSIIWLVGIIVIAWFQNTRFNKYLIEEIGVSISTSDAINLGMAIGTIALAIFAWIAYKSYWKQKKEKELFTRIIKVTDLMNSDLIKFRQDITSFIEIVREYLDTFPNTKINRLRLIDMISKADLMLWLVKELYEEKVILWETKIRYLKTLDKSLDSLNNYNSLFEKIHEVLPNKYNLFSLINDIKKIFEDHLNRLDLQIESNSKAIKEGLTTQQQPEDIEIDANCRDQYTLIDLSWIDSLDKIIEDFLSEQIRTFS